MRPRTWTQAGHREPPGRTADAPPNPQGRSEHPRCELFGQPFGPQVSHCAIRKVHAEWTRVATPESVAPGADDRVFEVVTRSAGAGGRTARHRGRGVVAGKMDAPRPHGPGCGFRWGDHAAVIRCTAARVPDDRRGSSHDESEQSPTRFHPRRGPVRAGPPWGYTGSCSSVRRAVSVLGAGSGVYGPAVGTSVACGASGNPDPCLRSRPPTYTPHTDQIAHDGSSCTGDHEQSRTTARTARTRVDM